MGVFTRPLASRVLDRTERLQTMLNMPFTLGQNLREQTKQGVLDSYGLGTVIRQGNIPRGNTAPPIGSGPIPNPLVPLSGLAQSLGDMVRGSTPQPSMSEDDYKASPYFRDGIPFEQGMTEARASALALFYDQKKVREFFGSKRPISTFLGQFGGQALDPINYIPVFGQAAEAATTARIGTIAGRAMLGVGDAAINTAAFGLMTAGLRDQFGDDVGWQALTGEIAMSALIGGAFGGVSGIIGRAVKARTQRLDRKLEAAVADALTDLRSVKESRAVLNEAVADLANGRDVNLTPNSGAVIERVVNEATSTAQTSRALRDQTSAIPETAQVAITPSGSRVEVRNEVVELDDLIAASGALQVRNRNSQASAAQVEQIATELDPARLMPSVDADSGAPIVGADNVIDSGNGRVMALRRAAEAYPERFDAYRRAIEARGFSTEGLQRPVLISRRVTDLSPEARAKFNAEANAPRAAQLSSVELAAMDRNALEAAMDAMDAAPVMAASNRPFVQRFLGELPPSARGALVDPQGNLNADGVRRIENALVAMAYGDVDLAVVRRFAEATDDNTRAIVGAMADVAAKWAIMRRDIKAGNISPEFDMTPELTEALRLVGMWREQAAREKRPVSVVIKEGMGQLDLLDGEVSPEAQVIIAAFYRDNSFARAAGRDTIADFLGRVADAATELGQPQLFGDAGIGRVEMLRNVAVNEQWNLFTPNGAVDGIEADGGFSRGTPPAADRQGGGQGTDQGRSAAATDGLTSAEREAISANLLRMAEAGDIEGIKASPDLAAVVAEMESKPLTDQAEGYGSDEWASSRVYQTDEGEVVGIEAAAEYLLNNARTLAAKETGAPAFEVAKERKAVIVIGPPAAGKSTIANELALRLKAAIPDADEAKKIMPEYDGGLGSAATHEESSFLTNDYVLETLKRGGENLVIPKVGGKAKSIRGLAEELRQWGYTVDLVLMDVPPQEAFRRMIGRYVSSGRLIPPTYFDEVSTAPARVFDELTTQGGMFDGHARIKSERDTPAVVSGSTLQTLRLGDGERVEVSSAAGGGQRGNGAGADAPAPRDGPAPARPVPVIDGQPIRVRSPDQPARPAVSARSTLLPNDGAEAEARVAKDETLRDIALSHGVDPTSGAFIEQADIEQLRAEGRLSAEDEAALQDADEVFSNAEAWGKALDAAVSCVA